MAVLTAVTIAQLIAGSILHYTARDLTPPQPKAVQ